jgi:hypothetical protein
VEALAFLPTRGALGTPLNTRRVVLIWSPSARKCPGSRDVDPSWHTPPVARLLMVLLLALAAQTTAVAALTGEVCLEECQDDGPEGDCAPGCDDCNCCTLTRLLLPPPGQAARQAIRRAPAAWPTEAKPESPDPAGILHVPIGARAV